MNPFARVRKPRFVLIRPRECTGVTEFSLGLGYVARALLNAGFQIATISRDLTNESIARLVSRLVELQPDIIGIGGMYGSFPDIIEICAAARKLNPAVPIILGGALPTSQPEHTLRKTGADFACVGPADESIVALANALIEGKDASDVPGLCYLDGDEAVFTPGAAQPRTLEFGSTTWPAWELFDGEAYVRGTMYYPFSKDDVAAPILTARGCPYSCNFCFQPMSYAKRPLDDVFDEMQWLIERYGVTAFYIEDDLFMLDRKRVMAFCDGIHTRNIRTKFTATGRFNIVDPQLLDTLKDAGCVTLFYGGESADDTILENMKKKITVEQMRQGISLTREAGIFVRAGFMFGQPGETRDHLESTVRFMKDTAYAEFEPRVIYGCVPFPGTDLFRDCNAKGLLRGEEDFFKRFRFQKWLLDQMPVNMTSISDADPLELLRAANQELLAFYEERNPEWMRKLWGEATVA